jgi:NTE family protein
MKRLLIIITSCSMLASGCASYTPTPRLAKWDLSAGYRFEQLPLSTPPAAAQPNAGVSTGRNSDELFVVLAFSGGGTRAAALSYGVLAQLKEITFHWNPATAEAESCADQSARCREMERSLLDEVDVISSVSGGSFTSAYYALRGDEIFDSNGPFHKSFLYYPVQRDLLGHAVYHPRNWLRLRSRVEIAAHDYGRNIFDDKTFADLQTRGRPYLVLNATDASTGARFEFTQEQFDLICADLSKVPIARGVAASSAFPGLLNSMTIDTFNAAGGCDYRGPGYKCDARLRTCPDPFETVPSPGSIDPDWVTMAMKDAFISYRRYTAARETLAYRDPTRTHLHLLDGGLADNIGLRSVLQSLSATDRPLENKPGGVQVRGGWNLLDKINDPVHPVKSIVIITVNAKTNRKNDWDASQAGPGTFSVINASSGVPMGNFSTETLELLREYGIEAALNRPGAPRFYGVEVAFENLSDRAEREFMSGMGTNFELAPFEVDCLIDRGARLLRDSTSVTEIRPLPFTAFVLNELKGTIGEPVTPHPATCTEAAGRQEIGTRGHYIDVGVNYRFAKATSNDVDDDEGVGIAVRVAKPNGFGATVGYGTQAFDVPSTVGGTELSLGELRLRTLSGGVFYARRAGRLEASAGFSGGYGFGAFELTREARERFGQLGVFGVSADATNAWLAKPNASVWYNLTSRLAGNVSAAYLIARPTIRFGAGAAVQERSITASMVQLSAGLGWKVF